MDKNVKPLSKGMLKILVIPVFLLAFGCNKKDDKPTLAPPVRVTVQTIDDVSSAPNRQYSGTVTSAETTTVSFAVSGTISSLKASEGQKVTKGQLLGQIKSGDYQNAYNIAQAQLAEARDGYDRLKKLHDAKALPDVKWVEMEQKLKQAENVAEMAERTLHDANLYSPVSGTITKKFADIGQTILIAEPIYEIVATDDLNIDISVSENEINNFNNGEFALISFESLSIPTIEGKISQKSVVADPLTRSYTIKISLPSSHPDILPGMIGSVSFPGKTMSGEEKKDIILPSQAVLLNDDNRLFVWTVKNGHAERRFVTADELNSNGVIIKSGITVGDSVIIAGMQKVGSGDRVIASTN